MDERQIDVDCFLADSKIDRRQFLIKGATAVLGLAAYSLLGRPGSAAAQEASEAPLGPEERLSKHFLDLYDFAKQTNPPRFAQQINQETGLPIRQSGPGWADFSYLGAFLTMAGKDPAYRPLVAECANVLSSKGGFLKWAAEENNHDIGQLGYLLGRAGELLGGETGEKFKNDALAAARVILGNQDPETKLIYWTRGKSGMDFDKRHIIDTIYMGIPVLWWAAKNGMPEAAQAGREAVYAVIDLFIREDGSVPHMLTKNEDGTFTASETPVRQGDGPDSAWGRGNSWAALGLVTAARENPGDQKILCAAQKSLNFIMDRTPLDTTFLYDFLSTKYEGVMDTSAQAIAAAAAVKMAALLGAEGQKYLDYSYRLTEDLVGKHLTESGGIKNGNAGLFAIEEFLAGKTDNYQVELVYADYFTLYSLDLLKKIS